jgi:hypothetical protein
LFGVSLCVDHGFPTVVLCYLRCEIALLTYWD